MKIEIPLDLPDHTNIQQFEWVERWARLPEGALSNHALELGTAHIDSFDGMLPLIKNILIKESWHWPEYHAHIQSGGIEFEKDLLSNMIQKVCGKWRSRHRAIHSAGQMLSIIYLRPFLQVHECRNNDRSTFIFADEDFFQNNKSPINCTNIDCGCRVDSLSRVEMRMFLEKNSNNSEAQKILSMLG